MLYDATDTRMPDSLPGDVSSDHDEATGRFGMWLFIASLTMLFLASLVGFLLTRAYSANWNPFDLPRGLWLSTALLVVADGFIIYAQRGARSDRMVAVKRGMAGALVFAIGFLVCQTVAWSAMTESLVETNPAALAAYTFYLLTGLHALHVIGGFVPLGFSLWRSIAGEYTARNHAGLTYCAMYWHFLGVVWLVIVAALYFGFQP